MSDQLPDPLITLLVGEIEAGNYSVRGLAHRYERYGATRSLVRVLLFDLAPAYMRDDGLRHGPERLTVRDHGANRERRRKVTPDGWHRPCSARCPWGLVRASGWRRANGTWERRPGGAYGEGI